jgi:hypothetical protein
MKKVKDEDRKEIYIKWKGLLLSYVDFAQSILDIEYIDNDEIMKYLGDLEDLIYDIKNKFIMGNDEDDKNE